MAPLREMVAELDRLLDSESFSDYGPNGLQVEGAQEVAHVATGVSASVELFERAIAAGAQLIVTHHGVFWDGDDPRIVGSHRARLRTLLAADVSLAAYHLPLDAHPLVGNNALIAAGLGFTDPQPFSVWRGRAIGVAASAPGDGIDAAELVARVKAILRRSNPKEAAQQKEAEAKILERGLLKMDPERHTCTWKNDPVTLTVTEFLILQALATRPGVVKSRNALMDAAYDDQVYVDDRTIDSHIKRLRKKFKSVDDDFEMIETLYGVGYRFKE